jgi:hypothetical protein
MIKLEIDDDVADEIVRASLVDTYVWLITDLKNAENNVRNYHEDDVAMWKKVVAAIEELSDWYFIKGKFKEAVKKAKKEM